MTRFLILSACILILASPTLAQRTSSDQNLANVATDIENLVGPQVEAELFSGIILVRCHRAREGPERQAANVGLPSVKSVVQLHPGPP